MHNKSVCLPHDNRDDKNVEYSKSRTVTNKGCPGNYNKTKMRRYTPDWWNKRQHIGPKLFLLPLRPLKCFKSTSRHEICYYIIKGIEAGIKQPAPKGNMSNKIIMKHSRIIEVIINGKSFLFMNALGNYADRSGRPAGAHSPREVKGYLVHVVEDGVLHL